MAKSIRKIETRVCEICNKKMDNTDGSCFRGWFELTISPYNELDEFVPIDLCSAECVKEYAENMTSGSSVSKDELLKRVDHLTDKISTASAKINSLKKDNKFLRAKIEKLDGEISWEAQA